ncbi:MAG: virulence protein E [Acidovorax sp.]|nr:virulence protein E [Acidovorax sp.]
MTQRREELPPIKFAALADALLPDADRLVPLWLPGGQQRGHEYVCGSLSGDKGSSCSVNLSNGRWGDFASDEQGGDLLSLYAAIHGLSMTKAALQVARENGLESIAGIVMPAPAGSPPPAPPRPAPPPKPPAEAETWRTVSPVPPYAVAPTFKHFHRSAADIEHTATYRVGDDVHGYVVRFRTSDGGKDTLPYTWCESARDGAAKWNWRQFDEPRPLFLPGQQLPGNRTVVLVEGERKAECLQALLDSGAPGVYCVTSWAGGSKAWQKADWAWLHGCTVLAWPDCDAKRVPLTAAERKATPDKADQALLQQAKPLLPEHKQPGMAAMLGIGALLRDAHACTVQLLPIPSPGAVLDGWDCRDAIETDGWDFDRVQAFFASASSLASDDGAAPVAKKIDPSVGTGSGDSGFAPLDDVDSGGLVKCGSRLVPYWLSVYYNRDKKCWLMSRKAVIEALQQDPALRGVIAFNELSNTIHCRKAWPWPHAKAGDIRSADALLLGKYLTDTYGLPSISQAALQEAIQTVAHTERYHPIREWLVGLEWDKKPRLDKWLVYALGESPQTLKPALMEYLSLVGRYWLLGMVNRVMEPGCKFDYCPVLEGSGGLRKSTLVEVLATKEYFSDTKFDVGHGKDGQEQMQGLWLYEIAEMAGMSKAQVGDIKAFISSSVDRYRVAYGTTVERFDRQCVLVGTTNDDTYLRDRTGNRRFWPTPVKNEINTDWVIKWRAQLFAEAFALYLEGTRFCPTKDEEKRLFEPMQDSRLVETAVESALLAALTRPAVLNGPGSVVHRDAAFVTFAQLVEALHTDPGKSQPGLENQIRGWLKQQGWVSAKKQINGARANGYMRPAVWPPEGGSVGLDREDVDADAPAPAVVAAPPAPALPQALSAAQQFVQDMDPDCAPF